MASEPSTRDSLKSEKLSLLILAVCVVVLVSLVVFRPF
jgi:predicted RND superfamily exporter protein